MAIVVEGSRQVYLPDGGDKVEEKYQHDGILQPMALILMLRDVRGSSVLSCLSVMSTEPNSDINCRLNQGYQSYWFCQLATTLARLPNSSWSAMPIDHFNQLEPL